MVQIFIKMSSGQSCPEWTIVELQGDLEMRYPVPLEGKFIGDLHFTTKEQPVLIIGHHILYGKKMQLEKPFVLLTKHHHKTSEETDDDSANRATEYGVEAIIKTKLLFKTRPKPILAHVPKKV
ncbi:chromosome transmission fidelity protein 8 homolog isoform X2 [Octopus bimaculoides]|uniref:chromosome transmission fidelity protein 8 homolog isoform X2 n=1 Tax=Octopus bimaculoides TaxID=37653 RepID=UPI00071DBBAF|nr:chromosome transmission fidelity protein 8 homolog isoform X2 [Octopus bimaculoides]|eukprot:XP_014770305.1 PREDICTED: chromosome transmission fidelity protein 8 homolog [Octopus bimaculoides]